MPGATWQQPLNDLRRELTDLIHDTRDELIRQMGEDREQSWQIATRRTTIVSVLLSACVLVVMGLQLLGASGHL